MESAASGAVSHRRIRGPRDTLSIPAATAALASSGAKPPSGPIITASRCTCRLPNTCRIPRWVSFSLKNNAISCPAAPCTACAWLISSPTAGMRPRPHCIAASRAIFCQRLYFLCSALLSGRETLRAAAVNVHLLDAPQPKELVVAFNVQCQSHLVSSLLSGDRRFTRRPRSSYFSSGPCRWLSW